MSSRGGARPLRFVVDDAAATTSDRRRGGGGGDGRAPQWRQPRPVAPAALVGQSVAGGGSGNGARLLQFVGQDENGNGSGGGGGGASTPTSGFQQDPRAFNAFSNYNRDDPRNITNRYRVSSVWWVLLCLVFTGVFVGVIVLGVLLNGIANKNKAGCTLGDYDNFQRGFGIDNGSCTVAQPFYASGRNHVRRVVGCPPLNASYTDLGGVGGGYRYVDPTADDDDDPYSSVLSFVASDDARSEVGKALCVRFASFDVVGADGACTATSLNITGSALADGTSAGVYDGVYCNEGGAPPLDTYICAPLQTVPAPTPPGTPPAPPPSPHAALTFNFTTDGTTDGAGWLAEVRCGVPGCTARGYDNFDAAAEIDDGSCTSAQPVSTGAASVMRLQCDGEGTYVDSGGAEAAYAANEFVQKVFNVSDAAHGAPNFNVTGKRLCFEFVDMDVQAGCGSCCDALSVVGSTTAHDGPHCSGGTTLQGEKVCSAANEPIYFRFASDASTEGAGWVALVTCEDAP